MPSWFEEWRKFYRSLTGAKFRGDKVAAMALVEVLSLPSSELPQPLHSQLPVMLTDMISMAENVAEREAQMKKRST